ncbi:MAG: HAD-IC family P-type ATPase, partial [Tepidiformaceae bacterium]
ELGIKPVVMLTGDSAATAAAVGASTAVDEVKARLLPEDKVEGVRSLWERFGAVAMLGDGVNDAPALAEATVGLAMGAAGSPATIETADVALMADDLTRLPYAIQLARRARRTVRFNIALALGLKLVLAVGAVTGFVSLAIAVLVGDMGGSLAVTVNALRLARMGDKA